MATAGTLEHAHWSSRFAFLMAAIGSSVGLGNFWRFPATAGESGGSLFIIIYLMCVGLVAFPMLAGEYAIGRRGQKSAVSSTIAVAKESGTTPLWAILAWVGKIGSFLILSFYSVVAGWVLIYAVLSFSGAFAGVEQKAIAAGYAAEHAETSAMIAAYVGDRFGAVVSNLPLVITAHAAFMALTVIIVGRGIKKGIELVVQVLMPLFFVMLIGVVAFGAVRGEFAEAFAWLTRPDLSVLFVPVAEGAEQTRFSMGALFGLASEALAQAFFSVGVGAALMITYGSYLNRGTKLIGSSGFIAGADTLVALVAGLAIFPIAFLLATEAGQLPADLAGPGLFFKTLPVAFAELPTTVGIVFGGAFFTLALVAAVTSSISLLEISVAYVAEKTNGRRWLAAISLGLVCWLIGLGSVYSLPFLDLIDAITGKVMLPLGGLLVALFVGWGVRRAVMRDEFVNSSDGAFARWWFLIRWIAPVGASVILVVSVAGFVADIPGLLRAVFGG